MRGDISRRTFDPTKHYDSVRLQQGRVQLDADSNEQVDITSHRIEAEARDLIGLCGAPMVDAGFEVSDGATLAVGPGHYYVNGILCENEDLVNLNEQADLPAYLDQLAPGSGLYVVYLDVWKRHITYIEDAAILETALGGVDTATRAKTVWQVRLVRVGNVGDAFNCLTDSAAYDNAIAASTGQMRARVQPGETSDDPCVIEPGAGYRRLENQLYRVEIHTPGPRGTATFVWSRINGSHVTRLEDEIGGELVVESTGRDEFLRFAPNQWVEVSDDTSELYGLPGVMLRLQKVEGNALTIDTTTPGSGPFDKTLYTNNPKVRGWDSQGQIATSTRWTPLEDGIEVRFEDGEYHTGDYWLIPARVATSSIEWPQEISGSAINWLPKVNDGIEHDYCRLAVVSRAADGTFTLLEDCRNLFPPLTELTRFFYVGGDGQETLPGQPIPKPLQVGVMNGLMPVEGVSVRFTAEEVLGRVAAVPADPNDIPTVLADGSTTNEVIVQTDADGVARCVWRPASDPPAQQVRAALLLTDGSDSTHPDLVFTGNLSLASQVAYDPSNCDTLAAAGADTVQAAIDELCKMQQPDDPGIRIIRIESSGVRLENDSPVSLDQLRKGVTVIFDNPVDKASIKRPVCSMTLELPISFAQGTQGPRLTIPPVVYQPLVLEASLNPAGDRLTWVLAPRTADWLQNFIMPVVQEMNARLLLWLRLKGNFIWSIPDRSLYLDGQAYGVLKGGITALDLPSGDGKRGGDFEMWMWLTPPEIAPTRGLNWSIEGAPNVGPLDPARVNDLADWTAITLMYAGLVRLDEDLTVQPDLAESFDVSNNNQVFTFTLRGDTAFSNGMPVSAGDVAFSLDRARQLIGGWSGPFYLDNIAEIQVIDDQTVQITLKQPAPHFLFQLTTAPARIIAAQFGGDDFTVTSGAYFVDAQADNLLTLVPNDNYWQKAGVEKIELFFRQSSEEAFAAYQSGEVDVMGSLQSAMPVQGLGDPDLNRTEASSGLRYLGFNHARFPFSNAAVRRAFGLAIDRAKLVSQFANLGQVAQRIVPPSLPSGALNFDLPFDPDQAIALLEEVGFQEMGAGEIPLHFALEGNNAAVIEVIQAMLQEMLDNWAAQVGVDAPKIVPQGLPLRPFSQQLNQLRINQGDMDMMLYYSFWGGDYPNLQNWLSQQLRTGRGNNNGQYSSDKFDSNADQADVTSNANSRRRLYQQAEQVALGEDMAWVPLFNTPAAALIRPNVSGLVMTPQGIVIPDYTKLKVTV